MSKDSKNDSMYENVWPQERDYMVRSDRIRYVRQLKTKSDQCVFCEALKRNEFSSETLVLHKNKHSMVILNKYPYNTGHVLVLPLRHEGNLELLSAEEITDLALLKQKCLSILKQEYNCTGLNIGLNHGHVAGAGIPEHLHWHIIPRWMGDTNFFPLIAETKVQVESLEDSYNRLRPYFK